MTRTIIKESYTSAFIALAMIVVGMSGMVNAGTHTLFVYGGGVIGINNDTPSENVTLIIDDVAPATLGSTTLLNGIYKITVDPATTSTITLTATVSDESLGWSNMLAANWTVGPVNWTNSWMLPSDGSWDNYTENVTTTINITGWLSGTYFIYVYGTDAPGNGQISVLTYAVLHIDGIGPAITGPWADNLNPYIWEVDTSFILTAYGDDRARGYSDVVAAEYFVDTVGANGTGIAMSPMGYKFDSPHEGARSTIDLSGWTVGESHTYFVHFKDAMGHWGDMDDVLVMRKPFAIPINLGWNLISIPLVDVIVEMSGVWDYALTFDRTINDGTWLSASIYRPGETNDFINLDHRMAFWFHIIDVGDGFINVTGTPPGPTAIHLYAGWNMVGYPTLNGVTTIADAFASITYDSAEGYSGTDPYQLQVLASDYVMQPGEGYWIKVPTDTEWVVDW
jgi:hypothetical protein